MAQNTNAFADIAVVVAGVVEDEKHSLEDTYAAVVGPHYAKQGDVVGVAVGSIDFGN